MTSPSRDRENEVPPPERAAVRVGRAATQRLIGQLRVVVGLTLFGLVVLAVVRSWTGVRETLTSISPERLLMAEMLVLTGLLASALTWRALLRSFGTAVPVRFAAKVYLVGQLAKYVPGSFWAPAAQMEMAAGAGVRRACGLSASVAAIAVNLLVSFAVGLLVVPSLVDIDAVGAVVLVGIAVACAVLLSPPLLGRAIDLAVRKVGHSSVRARFTWRIAAVTGAWSIASITSYGASVWLLAMAVGAPARDSLLPCVGGMALAMSLGFLAFVAPSGIGVREAVLVASLSPVLEHSEALAVALVARLLFTVGDLVAAAGVSPFRLQRVRMT